MENKKILFGLVPLLVLSILGVFAFSFMSPSSTSSNNEVQYGSNVCTHVTRVDGTVEQLGCSHNLVVDAGLNAIRDQLGGQADFGAFDYIALCNATAGCTGTDASDTTLDNEFTSAGLTRAQGTYGQLGTGNWSIYKTFTATVNALETNQTGIFNQSTGGTLLAENTFTLVTLQNNDQLTVNWTITVTNP